MNGMNRTLAEALEGRHTGTQSIAQWFAIPSGTPDGAEGVVEHATLQLALSILLTTPDGPELTVALRKLLEARDAWTRAFNGLESDA